MQRKCTVERMQQRYKDGCDSSLPNSRCNNVTTSLVDATKETPCLQTRAGAKHTSTEAHHRIKDVISPHRLPHSGNRFTSSNYITRSFLVFFLANERERERERPGKLTTCIHVAMPCATVPTIGFALVPRREVLAIESDLL